jgi:hypothetical protein
MNPARHSRRLAAALAGLAGALLAFAAAAPAALARSAPPSPPTWERKPLPLPSGHIRQPVHLAPVRIPVHTVVIGGMPGWQIALIAAGAALVAATVAVLVDRARAAHRKTITAAA